MSHTIIPSSCPLCVSVDVCKQRRLVSGHYTVAQASAERLTQAGSWETTNHIYALVWVFWWESLVSFRLKALPHTVQAKGFSPVWIRVCLCRSHFLENAVPQTVQLKACELLSCRVCWCCISMRKIKWEKTIIVCTLFCVGLWSLITSLIDPG